MFGMERGEKVGGKYIEGKKMRREKYYFPMFGEERKMKEME